MSAPGRLPSSMSLIPPLMAAVIADTLYLLLPQVTVPEGRERGRLAAMTAEAARRMVERVWKSMAELSCERFSGGVPWPST